MPRKPSTKKKATEIDSFKHKDTRVNIPTEELRDFVAEDEAKPKTLLYPRDPSLDPQLVWKGKDEQDKEDLRVPAVPVYIQEKIHPQAIIENLRAESDKTRAGEFDSQIGLFNDFNGIDDFEKKVDFYHHEGHWTNRMILGDSLLVMASLAEKEGLKGKVQTIFLDPPYGIKFGSNWQVSTRKRDVKDGKAEDASRQPEQIRAFRDTWKFGIHSYLAYLRDRLTIARELLSDSGSVFIQIGDENVHLVRCVLDEVFGIENSCGMIQFQKTTGAGSPAIGTNVVASVVDYVLWYARNKTSVKYRQLYLEKTIGEEGTTQYVNAQSPDGSTDRRLTVSELEHPDTIPKGWRVFAADNLTSQTAGDTTIYEFEFNGQKFRPGKGGWKTNLSGMQKLAVAHRLKPIGNSLMYQRFFADFPVSPINNLWRDVLYTGFSEQKVYVVQTSSKVVSRCLLMTTDPGDLVLDPTCGSGTTAFVAEQLGRRWITIDTSRVALALARTRLMAAKFPFYFLADSPEGIRKEAEVTGKVPPPHATGHDLRKGFIYKRVPHVTLKSIANNLDIKEGMSRTEIDHAISRHADTETLYDQPYEDPSKVRVTGPLTVESLSPHRVLATDEARSATEAAGQRTGEAGQFETMILENLRKAGVQNTVKGEKLTFTRLDPFAGTWVQGTGEYDEGGKPKRVAVSIGPEHGTVGPQQIKEAAKEAVQGIGFDTLIVCGFAFDPHVSEEVKRYGKLTVLITKMNPDLSMGDDLLKKTGAGNLFMVFGEPDIEMVKQKDAKLVVKIKGVDVYDPTTGQLRSHTTDDIACWFLDTDYNGESFFVRHAYFTGADEPYEKLKRALRAEIDESAWATLYATESRPFTAPKSKAGKPGKIAVKVINHYGDEVLKVYEVK